MATSKDFHDYVMDCLCKSGPFSSKKMMGEYCVYYYDKVIALICDNQLFLKPAPSILNLLPEAERAYPYEGSKTLMVIVDDPENSILTSEVFEKMYNELPETKKPKKRDY